MKVVKWMETGFYKCPQCKTLYSEEKFCINHDDETGYPKTIPHKIKSMVTQEEGVDTR